MKKKILTILITILALCTCLFTLTACGGNEPPHTHIYDKQVTNETFKASDATCEDKAEYYYSCSCGEKGTKTFENGSALGHAYGDWISIGNGQHKKTCANDNSHTITENCSGGTATCQVKATCSICNTVYGNLGEHSPKTTWIITETHHYHECTTLGCSEKLSHSEHGFTNYVSDKNATYESDGTKTATCNGGCGKTHTVTDVGSMLFKDEISFNTLTVDGNYVYGKVANSVEKFYFANEILISGNANFIVSLDEDGIQSSTTKSMPLVEGDNIFYVLETINGIYNQTYIITIHRNHMFTVNFATNGGTAINSQIVEENLFAVEPSTPTKAGYTFDGWDYNFSIPIMENTTITAKWTANKDTSYKVEYYLQNIQNDLYTLDEKYSYTDYGETDTIAMVIPKNIEHFTFDSSISKLSGVIDGQDSLVLVVYYTRNSYEIKLTIQNSKAGTVTGSGLYKYGKEITISAITNTGYTFAGWDNGTNVVVTERNTFTVDKDIDLVARWTANEYLVTYNANSGISNKSTDTAIYDDYFALATAERKGYNFDGWYDGSNKVNNGDWKIARDTTLTAKWKIVNYNISYSLDGGSTTNFATYTVEDSFTLNQPKKTGYTFAGWIGTDIIEANKFVTIEKGSIGERSYTATWTANEYVVTYNANGGVVDKSSDTAIYDSYFTLANVRREGYTFDGWYSETTKFTSGVWKTTEPVYLKAKWTANTYKIFYEVNVGELANTQQAVIYDESYSLAEPTRTGYTFVCWLFNGGEFDAGTWTIANNITLIAKWDANKYIVIYNANDGVCDTEKDIITYDTAYSVPTPTRVGYTFNGWYYKGIEYLGGKWTTAEDVTLTAEWIAHTNIPYVVNHHLENVDGSYNLEESQDYTGTSDTFVTPSTNTYTGFTSPVEQRVKVNPNGSQIVDYYYTRNSYAITYVTNGGESISTQFYKYQETIALPKAERESFTFGGWFTTPILATEFLDTTMSANDKIIYAWWKEENKPSDFTYTNAETITISSYIGQNTNMQIPSFIGGKVVKNISDSAFKNNTNLVETNIPNTVIKIDSKAFYGCTSLSNITIGNGIESIGSMAFYDCNGLKKVNYIGEIDQWAQINFNDYYSNPTYYAKNIHLNDILITDIVLTTATKVSNAAFYKCTLLKSVAFSNNLTSIGDYAFYDCVSLTSLEMPDSVNSIGKSAFANCSALVNIKIPNSVTKISDKMFADCTLLTKITINNKLTSIGTMAFLRCTALTSVTIPASVTSIGSSAFTDCDSLTKVNYTGTIDQWVEISFGDYDANPTSYANNLYIDDTLVTEIILTTATRISSYSLRKCISLTNIIISDSVTSIGYQAFVGCTALTKIKISRTLDSIGGDAFYNCKSLKDVYYDGTFEEWIMLSANIGDYNSSLTNATRYYYIENESDLPTDDGNYWHYVDGVPTVWSKTED